MTCGHEAAVPAFGRRQAVLWRCDCGKVWAGVDGARAPGQCGDVSKDNAATAGAPVGRLIPQTDGPFPE